MERRTIAVALLCLAAFSLSGCIGTSSSVAKPNTAAAGSRVWYSIDNTGGMTPQGLQVLRSRLDERFAAVRAPDGSTDAVHVEVTVTSYYMRPGAARAMVGIMAGKDRVLSTVKVLDGATGAELGQLHVESSNATAVGSAGGLLRGHADEIADFVLQGKVGAATMPAPAQQQSQPTPMQYRPKKL